MEGPRHSTRLPAPGLRGFSLQTLVSGSDVRARSRADADPAPLETDDVAEPQLPSAAAINLAVHGHEAIDDGLFHISTGVQDPSELRNCPRRMTSPPIGTSSIGAGFVIAKMLSRQVPVPQRLTSVEPGELRRAVQGCVRIVRGPARPRARAGRRRSQPEARPIPRWLPPAAGRREVPVASRSMRLRGPRRRRGQGRVRRHPSRAGSWGRSPARGCRVRLRRPTSAARRRR